MINVIRTGCSVVMMDRFTLDGLFTAIQKEKITYICAVPRLYLGMMFHEGAAGFDVSSLNVCVTGGAPMPPEFIPAFEKQFGVKILEGYGLTEASPPALHPFGWKTKTGIDEHSSPRHTGLKSLMKKTKNCPAAQ